jgi:hypothetical protein
VTDPRCQPEHHDKSTVDRGSRILAVGLRPFDGDDDVIQVTTGLEAVQLLSILHFDVVLLALLPDTAAWDLAETIRYFWPWQRWALVAADVTPDDERRAVELGACGVFEQAPRARDMGRSAGAEGQYEE